jgi:hypothetical protein
MAAPYKVGVCSRSINYTMLHVNIVVHMQSAFTLILNYRRSEASASYIISRAHPLL